MKLPWVKANKRQIFIFYKKKEGIHKPDTVCIIVETLCREMFGK